MNAMERSILGIVYGAAFGLLSVPLLEKWISSSWMVVCGGALIGAALLYQLPNKATPPKKVI